MFNLKRLKEAQSTWYPPENYSVQNEVPEYTSFIRGRNLVFDPHDLSVKDEEGAAIARFEKSFFIPPYKNGKTFDLTKLSEYLKSLNIIKEDDKIHMLNPKQIENPKEHFFNIGFWGRD